VAHEGEAAAEASLPRPACSTGNLTVGQVRDFKTRGARPSLGATLVDHAIIQTVVQAFQQFKQLQNEGKSKGTYGLHTITGSFAMPKIILGCREAIYVTDEPSMKRFLTTKHGAAADTSNQEQVFAVLQAMLNGALQGLQLAPTMLQKAKRQSAGPFMTDLDFQAVMMFDYTRYALIDAGFLKDSDSKAFVPFGTPLIQFPSAIVIGGSFD
jgi:hypothetical protein